MAEEMMVVDTEMDETVVMDEEIEVSGGGFGKVLLVLGAASLTALGGYICKKKGLAEKARIKKLEKAGYVVYKAEDVEVVEAEVSEEVEAEEK